MALMDKMMKPMMGSMSPVEKQDTMLKLMPEMVKQVKGSDMMTLLKEKMFGMMFLTHKSKFNFIETIQKVKNSGLEHGWYNPTISNHCEIEHELGLPDPNKVATVSMCIPRSAYEILKENKKLAVMMPMQINVYEEDGEVFVVWMNIEMMGKMFGPKVSKVMKEASRMLESVHENIVEKEG